MSEAVREGHQEHYQPGTARGTCSVVAPDIVLLKDFSYNKAVKYRVDQKKRDLEPETSLKGLMLRKLLDQSTFAYWALLDLI